MQYTLNNSQFTMHNSQLLGASSRVIKDRVNGSYDISKKNGLKARKLYIIKIIIINCEL